MASPVSGIGNFFPQEDTGSFSAEISSFEPFPGHFDVPSTPGYAESNASITPVSEGSFSSDVSNFMFKEPNIKAESFGFSGEHHYGSTSHERYPSVQSSFHHSDQPFPPEHGFSKQSQEFQSNQGSGPQSGLPQGFESQHSSHAYPEDSKESVFSQSQAFQTGQQSFPGERHGFHGYPQGYYSGGRMPNPDNNFNFGLQSGGLMYRADFNVQMIQQPYGGQGGVFGGPLTPDAR